MKSAGLHRSDMTNARDISYTYCHMPKNTQMISLITGRAFRSVQKNYQKECLTLLIWEEREKRTYIIIYVQFSTCALHKGHWNNQTLLTFLRSQQKKKKKSSASQLPLNYTVAQWRKLPSLWKFSIEGFWLKNKWISGPWHKFDHGTSSKCVRHPPTVPWRRIGNPRDRNHSCSFTKGYNGDAGCTL